MSETIKWSELTPMQRDDLIHEKVFGHQRQTATHTSRTRAGDSFSYSVTSWQTGGPDTPRYTRSMDAAWLVIEHVMRLPQSRDEALEWCGPQFALWMEKTQLWACTKEQAANEICKIALQACGVEVVVEER